VGLRENDGLIWPRLRPIATGRSVLCQARPGGRRRDGLQRGAVREDPQGLGAGGAVEACAGGQVRGASANGAAGVNRGGRGRIVRVVRSIADRRAYERDTPGGPVHHAPKRWRAIESVACSPERPPVTRPIREGSPNAPGRRNTPGRRELVCEGDAGRSAQNEGRSPRNCGQARRRAPHLTRSLCIAGLASPGPGHAPRPLPGESAAALRHGERPSR
jgi:hypothetical protein